MTSSLAEQIKRAEDGFRNAETPEERKFYADRRKDLISQQTAAPTPVSNGTVIAQDPALTHEDHLFELGDALSRDRGPVGKRWA